MKPYLISSTLSSLILLFTQLALAQPVARTSVIAHGVGSPSSGVLSAADRVEAFLTERHVRLVSMHEARDRYVALSRPAAAPDSTDLDVLAREARAAVEHVAFGRAAAAQKSVQEAMTRAERALESLNRETETARQVLDTCLALVRSELARKDRQGALDRAMNCRRLVPDVAPSERSHPAAVIGVLAEADDQLRRLRVGRLRVDSKPTQGCSVFVNGRHLGVTPFEMDRASAGEYRIQVECGTAVGRVHTVYLGDDPTMLIVDTDLDHVVQSSGRLSLSYANEGARRTSLRGHAVDVARQVGAEEALLVGLFGAKLELMRVRVSDGQVAGRVEVASNASAGFDTEAIQRGVQALLEGRVLGPIPAAPAVAVVAQEPAPKAASEVATTSTPPKAANVAPSDSATNAAAAAPTQAGPNAQAAESPRASPATSEPRSRVFTWITAGTAVALTGVSLTYAMLARKEFDDVNARIESCTTCTKSEISDLQDDGKQKQLISIVSGGLAGAAAVSAVVLWFVEGKTSERDVEVAISPRAVSATFRF